MTEQTPPAHAPSPDPVLSPHWRDRARAWLVALVFAATTAIGVQAVWWSWHPVVQIEGHATWDLLSAIVSVVGRNAAARWALVIGATLVALAAIGILRRRAWGLLLALPCSASLIACALLARYLAIFSEPRQYVVRSHYVQAATTIAIITVVSHGLAMVLSVRLLCRRPVRLAVARFVLGSSAMLLAGVPAMWLHEHQPGGPRNAAIMGACAATALAAWIACGVPKRGTALAGIGIGLTALGTFAVMLVLCLHDRPRRGGLYSVTAEHVISEVAVIAPLVLMLIGLCIVLRRHLAAAGHQDNVSSHPA